MIRIAAFLLAMAPGAALANAGVGYFTVAVPLVGLALVPAVLVEAPLLRFFLKVPLRRALALSFAANLLSALFGLVLGIAFDLILGMATGSSGFPPTRGGASAALVPWYFLSWGIEHSVIAKRLRETPKPVVRRATGWANLVTYLLMLVAALASPLFPARDSSLDRARLSEAVLEAGELRSQVTDFWSIHKRFPTDQRELGHSPPAGRRFIAALEKDGRIIVTVQGIGNPALDGRRIELNPQRDDSSGGLRWICSSPDIEPRYLPASCRPQAK